MTKLDALTPVPEREKGGAMGKMVEIQDRPEMAQALNDYLQVDPRHTAVITIDMKRSYLDPEVGSNPLEPEKARSVIDHTGRLLAMARQSGLPVIHVILVSRELPTA
ncbi:MAG: isochorismatase family protein, partial [Chloroflexi bacterium]|nr:isochorismatase family protein [Chloroflexota bacterium]